MLAYIIGILIVVAAIYVLWKSWTSEGMNWAKGIGALAALIAGLLVMVADWLHGFAN